MLFFFCEDQGALPIFVQLLQAPASPTAWVSMFVLKNERNFQTHFMLGE